MMLAITNNMEEPMLLSAPEVNNPIFSAQLVTNVLGKGYQVKLSTVPPLPALGSAQGQLILKTSWTNTPNISVPLVANIQPLIMATPNVINLPPGPLPNAQTNSVAIQNNSATNLLTLSDPAVNVPGVGVRSGKRNRASPTSSSWNSRKGLWCLQASKSSLASRRVTRSFRWSRCR